MTSPNTEWSKETKHNSVEESGSEVGMLTDREKHISTLELLLKRDEPCCLGELIHRVVV